MRRPHAHPSVLVSVGRGAACVVIMALLGASSVASSANGASPSFTDPTEPCLPTICESLEGKYVYQFAWNGIPSAKCEVVVSLVGTNERPYYCFEGTARTSKLADIFWRFRARAVALVDALSGRAKEIHVTESENAILEESVTVFNHESLEAHYIRWKRGRTKDKTISLEDGIVDLPNLGLTIGCRPLEVGDAGSLKVLIGEDPYSFDYRVTARERVRTARKEFEAFRVIPTFRKIEAEKENKLPKVKEMTVWLSGSEPHIPLMMRSKTFIGYVTGKLVQMQTASELDGEEPARVSSVTSHVSDFNTCFPAPLAAPFRVCPMIDGHRISERISRTGDNARVTVSE